MNFFQASTIGEKVKNFFGIFGNKPPYAVEAPGPCYCSKYNYISINDIKNNN